MRFVAICFSLLLVACGDIVPSSDEHELYHNYQLLKAYFYKPERIRELSEYEGMEVDEMYETLDDYFKGHRYTRYFPPAVADEKQDQIGNSKKYYSFGFEREPIDDTLVVSAVYPVSPAASQAGLKKRDKLLFANGVSLTGKDTAARYLNSDSLFEILANFIVLRGENILALPTMQKVEVQVPTVYLDSLDGIPFIRVTQYKSQTNNPNGTYAEFKNVLQEIKGTKTAIMDLRNNTGGLLSHCTAMAAELVPLGSELIYDIEHFYDRERGYVVEPVHHFANSESMGAGINWIFLINENTASCSERFLAAVRYNRPYPETTIIGKTTAGKGIAQKSIKTYLGGLAQITCLQSYYPNGETFHEIGIEPDVSALAKHLPGNLPQKFPESKTKPTEFGAYK